MLDGSNDLFAIDPGPRESAYVWMEGSTLCEFKKEPNEEVIQLVRTIASRCPRLPFAIEMVASYGKPVGAEVFETCLWIGRYVEAINDPARTFLLTRNQVKMNLCHATAKVTDAHIRQSLIDRYGPGKDVAVGKSKSPGPLFGVSGDVWSALAVAVTWMDKNGASSKSGIPS